MSTIRAALDAAGYIDAPDTSDELRECFLDYVAAGYWRDLELEEAREAIENGDISENDMIKALKR